MASPPGALHYARLGETNAEGETERRSCSFTAGGGSTAPTAGGVHWAPIKCRDGAQRCGVMTMQLARAFLHDHGVVERDNLDESRMEASGTIVID